VEAQRAGMTMAVFDMHEELDWFSGMRQLDSCSSINKDHRLDILSARVEILNKSISNLSQKPTNQLVIIP
jgi:hypothetical protein